MKVVIAGLSRSGSVGNPFRNLRDTRADADVEIVRSYSGMALLHRR
jgi:hypothetical protein